MDIKEELSNLICEAYHNYLQGDGHDSMSVNFADHLIANGVTVNEWISVKDRLPDKDGEHILVCYSDGWICDQFTPVDDGVTHWMPLPQPPKGE